MPKSNKRDKNRIAEMEEAVRFFQLFAARSRSVFWVRDPTLNKQIYVSSAYEQIWGRSCESLYKNPSSWIETVIPEDKNHRAVETRLNLLANHGPSTQYEERFRIKKPDGTIVWVKDTHFPIHDDDGKFIGFAGISDDITKDVLYEQELTDAKQRAEIANQAKSEFLAMMSHELRTPLNAILGMAQIMKKKGLSPELAEYVDIIDHSGNNLLALVSDILEFVRIESWSIKIINKPFNLHDLLSQIVQSLYYQATQKGLTLDLDFPLDVPAGVIGDANRIRQIILNLLNNAIKFTNLGGVKISVTYSRSKTKSLFTFTVADTGIGIHEDNQTYVFEKFSQVDSSYQRKHQGVGLGLAIVKELIEKMRGEIKLKSKLGQGSTFVVDLPLKLQKNLTASMVPDSPVLFENTKVKSLANYKILLVEDNEINQKIAKIMLEDLGCVIDMVDCGSAALAQLENHSYDVVFMDIGLPDMSGFEVVKKIRNGKTKSNIPIIAMTAHILERDRKQAFKAGMNGVIVKPINQEEISTMLMEILG